MSLGVLIVGVMGVVIGSILYYFLLPKEEETEELRFNTELSLSFLSLLFIILGLLPILCFCFGIDCGNYTPEKEDDMTILNGIAIFIYLFSLEYNITFFLKKLKKKKNKEGNK